MELNAITKINQDFIRRQSLNQHQVEKKETTPVENKNQSTGGKKILLALGGLAAAGIAAALILKKNKSLSLEKFKEAGVFDFGKAIFKDKPYTGKITIGTGSAQKVITYKKGKMVSAFADGILKKYNYNAIGNLESVDKTVNDKVVESLNLPSLRYKVLKDKIDLRRVLENQKQYSFENFYDEAVNKIQYKTKSDIDKINDILEYKDKMEYIAKSRALDESNAVLKAQQAQELYMAPFNDKLTYSGLRRNQARRSANVFKKMLDAQDKYNAPFEQKLSNKSAEESAKVFMTKASKKATKKSPAAKK